MTCHYLFDFLQKINSIPLSLSTPKPATMRTVIAVALVGLILTTHPAFGAGGLEAEVGDIQGAEVRPNLNNGKQDETEKARLKAVDEKIKRAEEEGIRPPAEGSGDGSDVPAQSNTGGTKP